jgi:hypothetical protein
MKKKTPNSEDELSEETLRKWFEALQGSGWELEKPPPKLFTPDEIYEESERIGARFWHPYYNEINHNRIPRNEVIADALRQSDHVPKHIREFLAEYIEDKLSKKIGRRSSFDPRKKEFRWFALETFTTSMKKFEAMSKEERDSFTPMDLALEEVRKALEANGMGKYKTSKIKKIIYEDCKRIRETSDPNHPRYYEELGDNP